MVESVTFGPLEVLDAILDAPTTEFLALSMTFVSP